MLPLLCEHGLPLCPLYHSRTGEELGIPGISCARRQQKTLQASIATWERERAGSCVTLINIAIQAFETISHSCPRLLKSFHDLSAGRIYAVLLQMPMSISKVGRTHRVLRLFCSVPTSGYKCSSFCLRDIYSSSCSNEHPVHLSENIWMFIRSAASASRYIVHAPQGL